MLLVYLVAPHEAAPRVLDVHLSCYAILSVTLLQVLQFHSPPLFKFLLLCRPHAYVFDLIQVALPGLLQSLQFAQLALQGALKRLV